MFIERVQVEAEGFLSGLDVSFDPSLNVIVGARGTGKTSLIELIRFCLDAGSFTEDAANRGQQQAIAILEGGAVTVTLNDGGVLHEITRTADGYLTNASGLEYSCTVLAQNEVEAVGAQSTGRLHLIDRFRDDREITARELEALQSQVLSLTTDLRDVLREGLTVAEQAQALNTVPNQLDEAREAQQTLLNETQATAEDRQRLLTLQNASQVTAARQYLLDQTTQNLAAFRSRVQEIEHLAGTLVPRPGDITEDSHFLDSTREQVNAIIPIIRDLDLRVSFLDDSISQEKIAITQNRADIDQQTRELRQALDLLQAGIGSATRRVAELEERQGQLNALQSRVANKLENFNTLSAVRDEKYHLLEDNRNKVFERRCAIAESLNEQLAPSVRITVSQSHDKSAYNATLVGAFRGSGIHYNSLVPLITENIAPFELTKWVEYGSTSELAEALGISTERSASIINALREAGTAEVLASKIEDGVTLELLDGQDYKPSEHLSIGQRCTAVLPVLLGRHGDPLVMDQPEDHLDNSFIASTLVAALNRRALGDQYIFSSHNANIPVLSNAENVIVMDADGSRGYVRHAGSLEDPQIIGAVSRIMEGGAQAFATRARFYAIERS